MPKVGNKEYPYTPAGKAAAKKAAAKTGKPVKNETLSQKGLLINRGSASSA
jgi:hypothetical protein